MKKSIFALAILAMTASCKKTETVETTAVEVRDSVVVTDEKPLAEPMDSVAMMKAWEKYMMPGDQHKLLATDVGNWDEEFTMYMSATDTNPMKLKMSASVKMIMGGRYQESKHIGMMNGQPFEGVSTIGHNNASNQMESTWFDNMGTGIMYMTGDLDSKTKTISLKGETTDPMSGKKKPFRETYTFTDENTRNITMYDVDQNGNEYKSIVIVMKRN